MMYKAILIFALLNFYCPQALALSYQEAYESCLAERGFTPPKTDKIKTRCRSVGNGEMECESENDRRGFRPESELICEAQAKKDIANPTSSSSASKQIFFESSEEKKAFLQAGDGATGVYWQWNDKAKGTSGSFQAGRDTGEGTTTCREFSRTENRTSVRSKFIACHEINGPWMQRP